MSARLIDLPATTTVSIIRFIFLSAMRTAIRLSAVCRGRVDATTRGDVSPAAPAVLT